MNGRAARLRFRKKSQIPGELVFLRPVMTIDERTAPRPMPSGDPHVARVLFARDQPPKQGVLPVPPGPVVFDGGAAGQLVEPQVRRAGRRPSTAGCKTWPSAPAATRGSRIGWTSASSATAPTRAPRRSSSRPCRARWPGGRWSRSPRSAPTPARDRHPHPVPPRRRDRRDDPGALRRAGVGRSAGGRGHAHVPHALSRATRSSPSGSASTRGVFRPSSCTLPTANRRTATRSPMPTP